MMILVLMMLVGCGVKTSNLCPIYPIPSSEVTNKILSLKDNNVNEWMVKQYKLNLKLQECNKQKGLKWLIQLYQYQKILGQKLLLNQKL